MEYNKVLDTLFESFHIDVREYVNRYQSNCPIHDGDNQNAFCVYKETGAWRCFTMGCHEKHGAGIFGLTRSLLEKNLKKEVSFDETQEYLEKILGGKFKFEFSDVNNIYLVKDVTPTKTNITRDKVRQRLHIPAEYYVGRGYTPEILDKYDVGLCKKRESPFYNRCVAPIYDESYTYMVGCTGRDVTGRSPMKWLHNNFDRSKCLYNSWFAKKYIEKTGTAVLVESPGNIWRLEEAGIHCGLAIFGTELSFDQMRLLSQYGVLNLVLVMDNGDAGKTATSRIVKKLKGLYNIVIPKIDYEDLGECPIEHVKKQIMPVLNDLLV